MSNWKPPTEWYLEQFSKEGDWKHGVDAEMIARVEGAMSTEAIDAISEELKANDCPADRQKLGNLLQHWAKIELSEDSVVDPAGRLKHTRNSARSLAKRMSSLKDQLDATSGDVAYQTSRHVQHRLRVHYTMHLFDALRGTVDELLPAVQASAAEELPRGRRENTSLHASVETLREIFEYVTEKHAWRTYDPIEGAEVSAFSRYVESAFDALLGNEAPKTDSAIRTVFDERKERDAALPEHMRSFDDD
ncbi:MULTISPECIES: hypothetical protein [Aliiruegeria]|uniref:Uncharacterized protein n=1 Tax=Aliiruegeria lutimaris TaxID=571298 RepID=A0A1G9DM26_9RHOB|nr:MULTISPECIES: hypothetical protein [Aliiruegeria]NDR55661.1 hypothetical protein [Pseudoruegeria sp. M32A2M]SDK64946.1 hypothetical protein SAMN04488026_104817 [Aliiruegeria lutimaris]